MRVPVVVLTGFLGSGKTTLLNQLLRDAQARGAKLGVIVNELGAIDIDGALLSAGGATPRRIDLPGGCVCCVLTGDLESTLIDLVATTPGLEAIVLETTGVAEPLPIAWALERAPVAERVRLASIVTLVDASTFVAALDVSDSVRAQVVNADAILVTKLDVATDFEQEAVRAALAELAPDTVTRFADGAAHAVWLAELLVDPPVPASRPAASPHVHDDACRHLDGHAHGIDSVWVSIDRVLDLEELEEALAELPANYVRIKGILQAVDGRDGDGETVRRIAVHRVGRRVSSEVLAGEDREPGRMVALGPGVNRDALIGCLERATR